MVSENHNDLASTPITLLYIHSATLDDGSCKFVDEVLIYDTEQDLLEIIKTIDWDIRIIGVEYKDKEFTGREQTLDKCYFNKRPHNFSSSELRDRVSKEHFNKTT